MSEPYPVKEVITYSDGSEKIVNFTVNPNAEVIEETVAKEVEEHRGETPAEDIELQSDELPVETVSEEVEEAVVVEEEI